jgi:hypothetical protein
MLEKDRIDQRSNHLGEQLSQSEEKCYRIIYFNGIDPIPALDIAKKLFNLPNADITEIPAVQATVERIKCKLGKEAIITIWKRGYISRRMLINEMVACGGKIGIKKIIKREIKNLDLGFGIDP